MDKYMKKSDVIAYIRKEAKEAQSAFDELGGESGIIAQAFNDLANDFSQGAVPYITAEEAFAQIPAAPVPQWISVKDGMPENEKQVILLRRNGKVSRAEVRKIGETVRFRLYSEEDDYSPVTHWAAFPAMPLPKPPKGGF